MYILLVHKNELPYGLCSEAMKPQDLCTTDFINTGAIQVNIMHNLLKEIYEILLL